MNLTWLLGSVVSLDAVNEVASDAPGPEQMAEMRETIERVMASLTRIQREVIQLVADGYSHAEIAERLDMTPRSVRGIIGTVREKAKEFK